MDRSERAGGNAPQTRRARYKTILLVSPDEPWSSPIHDALREGGYRLQVTYGERATLEALRDEHHDLVVLSDLVGDRALEALLEELKSQRLPPPVLLVASLHGEKRWEPWRALASRALLRSPFEVHDIVETTKALIGSPWEDQGAPS